MKKSIILFFLFIANISYSQEIQNTEWELYIDDTYEINFLFGSDTLYVTEFDYPTPLSIYNTSSDTFNIKDPELLGPCFFSVGDYWGSYTFEINNDTLTFHPIEDLCEARAQALSAPTAYLIRVSTSTVDHSSFEDVFVFPNPILNENLNISSEEKLDQISIYDAFGRLLKSSDHQTSFDLSQYPPQMFFVELVKGKEKNVRKIIKI